MSTPPFQKIARSEDLVEGKGRPYQLDGHRIALVRHEGVVYALDDLQAWADRGAVTSTSDPRGTALPAKRHDTGALSYAGRGVR